MERDPLAEQIAEAEYERATESMQAGMGFEEACNSVFQGPERQAKSL